MNENTLRDMLRQLEQRQEAAIEEVKDRVIKALQEKRKEICIYSFLCKTEERGKYLEDHSVLSMTGLFQQEWGEGPIQRIFLEADSKTVEKILQAGRIMDAQIVTNYESYPIQVKLQRPDDLIRKIGHINRLLVTNHVDAPPINDIYAKGFVDICFAECRDKLRDDEYITELHVNWDDDISRYVNENTCLVWNITESSLNESIFPKELPYVDTIHYLHVLDMRARQHCLVEIDDIDESKVYYAGQTLVVEDDNPYYKNWIVYNIADQRSEIEKEQRIVSNKKKTQVIDSFQARALYTKGDILRNISEYAAMEDFRSVWLADERTICFLPKNLEYVYNKDLMDYIMADISRLFPGLRLEGRIAQEE